MLNLYFFADGCGGMAAKNTHTKAPCFEVSTKEALCTLPETDKTYIIILMGLMGVSVNGGTQQPWVFPLIMIILGCFGDTTI